MSARPWEAKMMGDHRRIDLMKERIEALEADRDCWIDQCSQRVADWSEAQARIEAYEALMWAALFALEQADNFVTLDSVEAVVTALRKRLESSNG